MKILFVTHDAQDGIGSHSAGLRRAIPAALGPHDNFVVRSLTGTQSNRAARIVDQQLRLPFAERDADLVHLPDFRTSPLDRHRVLLTVHDVCFLDRPDWFPRSVAVYKSAMLKLAAATRPAAIVCVSEYTRNRLVHHLPRLANRAHVIRPGIDEPEETASEPTGAESYFLTISTIEPRKNHLGLLRAFERARRDGLGLRWKVAGKIRAQRRADRRTALRQADGVDVIGQVTDEARELLFRDAAFVAVPSFIEGFGIPAGEAMVRGVPVIVATGSGLDEVGEEAALRLAPADVEGWADALRRVEGDLDLRHDLRRRGLEAAKSLRWSTAAVSYVQLYRSLVR